MKFLKKAGAAIAGLFVSVSAMAAGPDLTPLTTAVDVTTVIAAVLAVAVIGVGFILAKGGSVSVMNFIRGALR